MHCERYGRRLCNVPQEELDVCKAAGQNCFSCGCLRYDLDDLDDLDFESAGNWPPEEPDPWEGRTAHASEEDGTQPITVEAAADTQDENGSLPRLRLAVAAYAEKIDEVITAYSALVQVNQNIAETLYKAYKEVSQIAYRALMQAAIEIAQKLAEELNKAFEEIGNAADLEKLLKQLEEIAWEDEDRETMRPEKKTAAPRPLLLRSCSLRVLYGQGFDPGPAARHR